MRNNNEKCDIKQNVVIVTSNNRIGTTLPAASYDVLGAPKWLGYDERGITLVSDGSADCLDVGAHVELGSEALAWFLFPGAHVLHAVLKIQNKTKFCVSNLVIQPVCRAVYSVSNQKKN